MHFSSISEVVRSVRRGLRMIMIFADGAHPEHLANKMEHYDPKKAEYIALCGADCSDLQLLQVPLSRLTSIQIDCPTCQRQVDLLKKM